MNPARRNLLIAGSVVLFHVAALWALQSGLLRRTVELLVPVALLSELVAPPAPKVEPPAPLPEPQPPQPVRPPVAKKEVKPAPPPLPVARPEPAPAPAAPTGSAEPQPAAPPLSAPVAAATPAPPAAAAAPARIELPSSDADYLGNPKPRYPPMSKRLGEQGRVVVRVFIGTDGRPQKAELKQSSGYAQLDREALDYVMRCRYVPGKVGGAPQAMWHDAPVNFVLDN